MVFLIKMTTFPNLQKLKMTTLTPLKNCPCCNGKVFRQDDSDYYFNCPNCGELFQSYSGTVYWTNNEGQPTESIVKPRTFLFRETGLNLGLF
jgi:hypothetical protein